MTSNANETRISTRREVPWPVIERTITTIITEKNQYALPQTSDTYVKYRPWPDLWGKDTNRERTQLRSELLQNQPPRSINTEGQQASDIETIAEQRLILLARKYVSHQFSREELARLSILTEKVRRLISSVTENGLEAMESISSKLAEISSENAKVRKKYDIEI